MGVLIGVTGHAGCGKDTFADILAGIVGKSNLQRVAFATPIKEVCEKVFCTAYGVEPSSFWGSQEDKNAPLEQIPGWSGRAILQHIGTECFRSISESVWVDYLVSEHKNNAYDKLTVVTDVRFPNEAEAIRKVGGTVVRINRDSVKEYGGIAGHASESLIDKLRVDVELQNNDSLGSFAENVHNLLLEVTGG